MLHVIFIYIVDENLVCQTSLADNDGIPMTALESIHWLMQLPSEIISSSD